MSKPKVFIDGQSGTAGLQIYDRVKVRNDIEIMQIPEEKRKDDAEEREVGEKP